MTHYPIHIMHLTSQWLRWVAIQPGAAPQILDSGTIEGAPERSLENWAGRPRDPRSHIALYDGRPIYFSFSLTLPAEALKQQDRILRLKMTQELGMGEDAVFWAARTEARRDRSGQSDVFMVVVRREAMKDVVAWREKHQINNMWVGADVCAIQALLGQAVKPLVIVNADERGVTIFHANNSRQIMKERTDSRTAPQPDLGWSGAVGRIHFGPEDVDGLFDRYPTLGALPAVAANRMQSKETAGPRLDALPPRLLGFDPVLLGGVLDHATGRPPIEDLIREITPPPLEVILQKFTMKRLAAGAVIGALVLALSIAWIVSARGNARERLSAQAAALEPSLRQLQAQDTILRAIKTNRKPLLPVFEAIHKAAPQGMVLKVLSVGESGMIQMEGQTQSSETPNQFARDLAQSPLLDRIALKEVKQDPKTRMISFQIVGHAKGRGK